MCSVGCMTETKTCKKCGGARDWFDGGQYRCRPCRAGQKRAWRERSPALFMLRGARQSAKRRGHHFALTVADLGELPTHCPALGIELVYGGSYAQRGDAASIDRIDNARGYVPGNVVVVSFRANAAKGLLSVRELRGARESTMSPTELRQIADFYERISARAASV